MSPEELSETIIDEPLFMFTASAMFLKLPLTVIAASEFNVNDPEVMVIFCAQKTGAINSVIRIMILFIA